MAPGKVGGIYVYTCPRGHNERLSDLVNATG